MAALDDKFNNSVENVSSVLKKTLKRVVVVFAAADVVGFAVVGVAVVVFNEVVIPAVVVVVVMSAVVVVDILVVD